MSGTSRRKFLATAGAGAAAVGVAGALPSIAGSKPQLDQDVVVTVANASKGVFTVLVGERAVQVTDKAFAGRIADALRSARTSATTEGA